eukprot:1770754-Pleurochrysis_carterae.AAC.4
MGGGEFCGVDDVGLAKGRVVEGMAKKKFMRLLWCKLSVLNAQRVGGQETGCAFLFTSPGALDVPETKEQAMEDGHAGWRVSLGANCAYKSIARGGRGEGFACRRVSCGDGGEGLGRGLGQGGGGGDMLQATEHMQAVARVVTGVARRTCVRGQCPCGGGSAHSRARS